MRVHAVSAQSQDNVLMQGARGIPTAGIGFREALEVARLGQAARTAASAPDTHVVRAGETLWGIVRERLGLFGSTPTDTKLGAAVQQVARANRLKDPDFITVGQQINLSTLRPSGQGEAVQFQEALRLSGARPAQAFVQKRATPAGSALTTLPFSGVGGPAGGSEDDLRVSRTGTDLKAFMQAILHPKLVRGRDKGPAPAACAEAKIATNPADLGARLLGEPARITSEFGRRIDPFTHSKERHDGIDFAAAPGTRIFPYRAGQVVESGWAPGFGRAVRVRHSDDTESLYCHNLANLVKVGDPVDVGTPIGLVGTSGRSTGPHLHFEIHQNGHAVDPVPLLKGESLKVAQAF